MASSLTAEEDDDETIVEDPSLSALITSPKTRDWYLDKVRVVSK